jgi:hypothetical protein
MPKRKAACTAKASANVQAPNKKQFTLAQARKLILDSESNSDSADNLETESDSNVDDSDHESHTVFIDCKQPITATIHIS